MKISLWISGAVLAAAAMPVGAADRYEGYIYGYGDNSSFTYVELLHGRLQTHDLEAAGLEDEDWSFVQETLRHSYEVTVENTAHRWSSDPAESSILMNRVDEFGTILTPGAPANVYSGSFAVRWIATPMAHAYSFVRVEGFQFIPASAAYEIEMRDTTYMIPRWNNANGQFTVFLVQNATNRELTGNVYFYQPDGTLLHTEPFGLQPYGLYVLNTGGLTPLAGQSGSAAIAHIGGYGALSGKAVALEPATGYSFDTALTPIPY